MPVSPEFKFTGKFGPRRHWHCQWHPVTRRAASGGGATGSDASDSETRSRRRRLGVGAAAELRLRLLCHCQGPVRLVSDCATVSSYYSESGSVGQLAPGGGASGPAARGPGHTTAALPVARAWQVAGHGDTAQHAMPVSEALAEGATGSSGCQWPCQCHWHWQSCWQCLMRVATLQVVPVPVRSRSRRRIRLSRPGEPEAHLGAAWHRGACDLEVRYLELEQARLSSMCLSNYHVILLLRLTLYAHTRASKKQGTTV